MRVFFLFLQERGALRLWFFFQAEDGIRDADVTGVQTCALPIYQERAADDPGGPRPAGEVGGAIGATDGHGLMARRQSPRQTDQQGEPKEAPARRGGAPPPRPSRRRPVWRPVVAQECEP